MERAALQRKAQRLGVDLYAPMTVDAVAPVSAAGYVAATDAAVAGQSGAVAVAIWSPAHGGVAAAYVGRCRGAVTSVQAEQRGMALSAALLGALGGDPAESVVVSDCQPAIEAVGGVVDGYAITWMPRAALGTADRLARAEAARAQVAELGAGVSAAPSGQVGKGRNRGKAQGNWGDLRMAARSGVPLADVRRVLGVGQRWSKAAVAAMQQAQVLADSYCVRDSGLWIRGRNDPPDALVAERLCVAWGSWAAGGQWPSTGASWRRLAVAYRDTGGDRVGALRVVRQGAVHSWLRACTARGPDQALEDLTGLACGKPVRLNV